jgi:UPF0755 protein
VNGKKINKISYFRIVSAAILLLVIPLYIILLRGNDFSPSPKIFIVTKGESFSRITDSLEANGIINSKTTLKIAGRVLGMTRKIKWGKYSFPSGISNYSILRDIENGFSTVPSKVTVVEGMRSKQIARILHREVGIDSARFVSLFSDTSLIGLDSTGSSSLEGYLLPDTYEFSWQEDEQDIAQRFLKAFREFYVDSLRQKAKSMGLSLNEVLTMASIVEAEAVHDDERAIIAGVYYNRLRIHMPLQADPTVQYAISDTPKRLMYDDLKIDSPYNTYRNIGLPPGPINNPGRLSILAALYPEQNKFLYFVSNANGRHRFSKNYSEHLRNVRSYRKARALARN